MYKIITIGGKDYKLEYSVEAALYADCVEAVNDLFVGISYAAAKDNMDAIVKHFSNIPSAGLTMFYAGLIEHHGPEGDQQVMDKHVAKKLLKQYLKEHETDDTGDFYGLITMLMEKMGEDNFFKMTGLESIMRKAGEDQEDEQKPVLVPQDHKTKSKKPSAKQ